MKKQDNEYFLNRLAINYNSDPLKIDPIKVLSKFFEFAPAAEHLQAFDDLCLAALNDQYTWKRGSPGNGLYYGEQLELLTEVAWLIHQNPKKYRLKKKAGATVSTSQLPILLTGPEWLDPLSVMENFFTQASLAHWKKLLGAFTSAAISNGSVTDDIEAADIFLFMTHLPKLVYAAARLTELVERK